MAKVKTVYVCRNCGVSSAKWVGCCSSCGEWNSFDEEIVAPKSNSKFKSPVEIEVSKPRTISEIKHTETDRFSSDIVELNRVLGGGFVPGSMILLGGDPGIGKSTLILQVAMSMKSRKVLYVSGEESLQQIKLRADRVAPVSGIGGDIEPLFLSETDLDTIMKHVVEIKPDLLVLDSIQTLSIAAIESSPGTVTQIKECTTAIMKIVKPLSIATVLIGHINKEGSIAGPKVLEHIVDTVVQFEGDRNHLYRILRSVKNRFGSTSEIGIFAMGNKGLTEVTNPSEMLLSQSNTPLSGTAVAATVDGIRSFMIEVQALVSSAAYGNPQRSSTGFDSKRLNMLLAVLEKRAGFKLMTKDVFINIAGGIKVYDPAMDMAILAAIMSSNFDLVIPGDTAFAGEIGLTGEIRAISRVDARIGEASKLGFKRIFLSKYCKFGAIPEGITVIKVDKVTDLVKQLFR